MVNQTFCAWFEVVSNNDKTYFKVAQDGIHLEATNKLAEKCTLQEVFSISTAHLKSLPPRESTAFAEIAVSAKNKFNKIYDQAHWITQLFWDFLSLFGCGVVGAYHNFQNELLNQYSRCPHLNQTIERFSNDNRDDFVEIATAAKKIRTDKFNAFLEKASLKDIFTRLSGLHDDGQEEMDHCYQRVLELRKTHCPGEFTLDNDSGLNLMHWAALCNQMPALRSFAISNNRLALFRISVCKVEIEGLSFSEFEPEMFAVLNFHEEMIKEIFTWNTKGLIMKVYSEAEAGAGYTLNALEILMTKHEATKDEKYLPLINYLKTSMTIKGFKVDTCKSLQAKIAEKTNQLKA